MNTHHQPLKITEDICVFGKSATTESKKGIYLAYNPQMRQGFTPYSCKSGAQKADTAMVRGKCKAQIGGTTTVSNGERFPINVLTFARDREKLHPTQKPVDLLRYLILTYTNSGEVILDNTIGSGSTAIACLREGRKFIGFEKDEKYFQTAQERIKKELSQPRLF